MQRAGASDAQTRDPRYARVAEALATSPDAPHSSSRLPVRWKRGVPIGEFAAGLGLDYALFFEHAGDDLDDQLRTFHALLVCSATTFIVFFLLALSSIPVLRAIGSTVTLGVFINFVLALLVARHPSAPAAGAPSRAPPRCPGCAQ